MHPYEFMLDDMKFSFSSLTTYERCPYNFYLNYILKKENMENGFSQYGTFCHSLLEQYAKGEIPVYSLLNTYKEKFDDEVILQFPYNRYVDLREKYYENGIEYFREFEGFDDYEILGVEKEVNFKIGKYNMTGIIDLVVRNKEGKIEILDHKSKDLKMPPKKKWQEDRYNTELYHYLRQLYIYSVAIFDEYGEYPSHLNFNCFRIRKWFRIPFEKPDYDESVEWVTKTIEKIYSDYVMADRYENKFFCNNICSSRRVCDYSDSYDIYIE